MIDMEERTEDIYNSLKRSARGSWNYDTSTMTLVIDLGGDNILKFRVPDRDIGVFLARSANRIAWLLEALFQTRESALSFMDDDTRKKFTELVKEKLEPSEGELDDLEEQTLQETVPGSETGR